MPVSRWPVLCVLGLCACNGIVTGGTPDAGGGGPPGSDAGRDAGSGGNDAGNPGADAGTRDAGGVDAGPGDAGPGDAGSCVGALLCDDFESYPAGGPPKAHWTVNTNSGSVTIDTTRAHSGTQSVHIVNNGANAYEQAFMGVSTPIFPVAGGVVYGRMVMWLNAAPTQTTHWTNISGEGQVTGQGFSAYVRYGGQVTQHMMANYDTSGVLSDCWHHSTTVIPTQRWACIEWRYDTPNNRMDLWLDGAPVTDLTVMGLNEPVGSDGCINSGTGNKWPMPTWSTFRLGWEHYQPSDPISMWIDDVAMDTQRIGCPP